MSFSRILTGLVAGAAAAPVTQALAQAATEGPRVDTGDTAWMIMATALVLLMTPGLAFFYAGMVRTKNVVSTLFQSIACIGVVAVIWAAVGYSLAFSGDTGGVIGNLNWAFLQNVGQTPNADYAATIPHNLFMLFQCMFAIITPALMTGAFAERVKFKAWIAIAALWSLVVYVPVAHWVWGVKGWIRELGGLDFAGGLVVHMTAGYSALALAFLLGKRRDFGTTTTPHDNGMVLLGTGLLWFGWFGFNGGSALGANGLAAQAATTTFLSSCTAVVAWCLVETLRTGRATLTGACIAAVAGLVCITPAAGFVTLTSALFMGAVTGVVCYFAMVFLKERAKLDDTLDVFACHGVGGTLGTIFTTFFATKTVNAAGADGILAGSTSLLKAHLLGGVAVAVYSLVATFVIYKVVGLVMGSIRVSDADEVTGLDATQHGQVITSLAETTTTIETTSDNRKSTNRVKGAA